ncbi:vanadium-dependent haloperoxidase [Allonocardiopsis opalescens]|uniref:Phosphoesterase n=1 Tax=Allonocardiopsis opalescens TaxID=1144618 RepID=A0A2T0QAY2_9ACTN|nr:vanadium-dependent haloperoxidase [Allonocardiopsis opalescens]PRY01014.1 hypothetical protein CLV72_102650 [Allonocardiopsis opalescens]
MAEESVPDNVNRRRFLGLAGAGAGAGMLTVAGAGSADAQQVSSSFDVRPGRGLARRRRGAEIRKAASNRSYRDPYPRQETNGEEAMPGYLGAYHKGMPHNEYGEVDTAAYEAYLHAFETGDPADFDAVPPGVPNARPQLNPQIIYAYDLQGPDSYRLLCPPAPSMGSAEFAGEMVEDYWMALLRDVPFIEYESNPALVDAAATSLSGLSGFAGPKQGGRVTARTLFRGNTPGDLVGPYVSQFLLRDVQFGPHRTAQRLDTVRPNLDFATEFGDYLLIQRGDPRATERNFSDTRYIRNARDLAHYTHFDQGYQPYINAALILLASGIPQNELLDQGNPYLGRPRQMGFATFGMPHLLTLIAEADKVARKPNLLQQWGIQRRLRPEVVSCRIEVQLNRAPGRYDGLLNDELLNADVLDRIRSQYGSYLLPQAFPEASPMSPDYPSGHATVAGACATVLKAWFNEDCPLPDPLVPNADGTALVPYTGSDAGQLTIGGELNKLAANIGNGRNMGGVHWRSSFLDAFTLGEEAAIGLLRDQKATTNEQNTFHLTRFDGTTIEI